MPEIVEVVRDALRAAADPARAPGQQAYMKSEMPFLGVTLPEVRRIVRTSASQTSGCRHPAGRGIRTVG